MSDTARVLLTAAALTASATTVFTWRVVGLDAGPERLIGQLRLAQWGGLLLALIGGVSVGLAVAHEAVPIGTVEITLGLAFAILGGFVLTREPREALLVVSGAFVLHALIDIAHRPDWLSLDLLPRWYAIGSASFDVYIAALSYWARRR